MKKIAWGPLAIALALTACSTSAPSPEPSPTPSPTVTPSPTSSPSPEPAAVHTGNVVNLVGVTATASITAEPSTDASGNTVTYDASLVLDGDPSTAWRAPGEDAWTAYLLIQFDQPVTLSSVGLIPGYAKVDPDTGTDRFMQNHRIESVSWVFSDGSSWRQGFTEEPTMQTVPVAGTVEWVRIEVNGLFTVYGDWYAEYDFYEDRIVQRDFIAISDIELVGTPAS